MLILSIISIIIATVSLIIFYGKRAHIDQSTRVGSLVRIQRDNQGSGHLYWHLCRRYFVVFFIIAILEDSGYMARAAFVMDKLMTKPDTVHGEILLELISAWIYAPTATNQQL